MTRLLALNERQLNVNDDDDNGDNDGDNESSSVDDDVSGNNVGEGVGVVDTTEESIDSIQIDDEEDVNRDTAYFENVSLQVSKYFTPSLCSVKDSISTRSDCHKSCIPLVNICLRLK